MEMKISRHEARCAMTSYIWEVARLWNQPLHLMMKLPSNT